MLSLLPVAGPVLDYQELCGYSLELRKLMLDIPSMSATDLLKAFNAAYGMCFAVASYLLETLLHYLLKSLRQDITLWFEEAQKCRPGPGLTMPPLDEDDAKVGGDTVYEHFFRQWSITFCSRCGLRHFNGRIIKDAISSVHVLCKGCDLDPM